jgi:FkbM family methyltransferase
MSLYTRLPCVAGSSDDMYLDIVDGHTTAVQRALRRTGIAGYEPPTVAAVLAAFEMQQPGFTMFDVGANIGLYASLCSGLFDPANVIAFEPTPSTADVARKIARVNRLRTEVVEIALGDAEGKASLYLSEKSDSSNSLVEGFKTSVGTIEVAVTTLDEYAERTRLVPDIVKIDAETFEPQILAGSRKVLQKHRPLLVVEVLHRRGHDHGVELMDAIDELGYHFYRCATHSDWQPQPRIEGDPEGTDDDWLLSPTLLPSNFRDRVEAWESAIAECTGQRNVSSLPTATNHASTRSSFATRARAARRRARRLLGR